ncbi:hypothetical protein Cni_G17637 [Canna indica]|uniref:Trichome birefringence-like N-terminal domain-containing protein n=1 Tax=Canna indica TaxID=4628 RepID=A0AAQ3KI09_9LILI|nr:hypothetical protein Cni_G17637 [Canna indica]
MQRKKVVHSRDDEQGQECEMATNNQFTLKLWSLRYRFNSTVTVFIAFVIVLAIFITIKNGERAEILATVGVDEACDLFSGQWVYDNTTYPLYLERGCRFMSEQGQDTLLMERSEEYNVISCHAVGRAHDVRPAQQTVSVELEPNINAKGGRKLFVGGDKEAMEAEEEEEKLTSAATKELWEQKRKRRRS